jgi:hypothetical protein
VGHQVNFYLDPVDTEWVEQKLRAVAPFAILHSRSSGPEPRVVGSLDCTEGGKPWLYFYLVQPQDLQRVVTRHVPAQGYWTVDVLRSPVVELNRSFFNGQILRRGRVYYVDGFYGPDGSTVEKEEQFRTWAKSLLSTTKKALKRHGSDYIGPNAEAWLASSGGRLEP